MNSGLSKFLIILFGVVLLVAASLIGIYFLRSNPSKTAISNPITSIVNKNNSETVLEFSSRFPGITFAIDDKQKAALDQYLQKLNLTGFQNKAFIGSLVDKNQPSFISPKKIIVTFSDLANLPEDEKSDGTLGGRKILDETGIDTYFAGKYDSNSQELTIPIYVGKDYLLKSKSAQLLISQIGLESLFLNFRNTPVSSLGNNPTDAFYKQIGTLSTPIVIVSGLK